jgi:3D (Asp-Asp-Asp) domain-containing protein
MRSAVILAGLIYAVACGGEKAKVISMKASAFTLKGKTAAGTPAREGIVAADPDVLPLGTRIRVSGAGAYDGVYIVTDTGRRIQGQEIDIYVRTAAEAKEFGEKMVKVAVLQAGNGREDARQKDQADREAKKP